MSFTIRGKVEQGSKLGRELGFPTANIAVAASLDIENGVYAALVYIDCQQYKAMANLGVKPSVSDAKKRALEVNIFDYCGDLYGKEITVELTDRVRAEQKFDSIQELKAQIERDRESVMKIFKSK